MSSRFPRFAPIHASPSIHGATMIHTVQLTQLRANTGLKRPPVTRVNTSLNRPIKGMRAAFTTRKRHLSSSDSIVDGSKKKRWRGASMYAEYCLNARAAGHDIDGAEMKSFPLSCNALRAARSTAQLSLVVGEGNYTFRAPRGGGSPRPRSGPGGGQQTPTLRRRYGLPRGDDSQAQCPTGLSIR